MDQGKKYNGNYQKINPKQCTPRHSFDKKLKNIFAITAVIMCLQNVIFCWQIILTNKPSTFDCNF